MDVWAKTLLRMTSATFAAVALGLVVTMNFEVFIGDKHAPASDTKNQGLTWLLEQEYERNGTSGHVFHSCSDIESMYKRISADDPSAKGTFCNNMRGLVYASHALLFVIFIGSIYTAVSTAVAVRMHRKILAGLSLITVLLLITAFTVFDHEEKAPMSNELHSRAKVILSLAITFTALHCGVMTTTAVRPDPGENDPWYHRISHRMI